MEAKIVFHYRLHRFHRLFIGIAILSVLICVICGEKAEYGCHNYISGCFFPDAFKRESHDKSAIITALIGYGGGCVADGIGHDWKAGDMGRMQSGEVTG